MVNVIGHVAVAGTPVPSLDKERAGTCVSECHTRKATPAEMRRYFSLVEKSEQGKPVSPTAGVPEETREMRRRGGMNMSGIAKVKEDGRFIIDGAAGSAVIDYHEGELWRFQPSTSGANMLGLEFGEDIHLEVTVQKFYKVFDVIKKG